MNVAPDKAEEWERKPNFIMTDFCEVEIYVSTESIIENTFFVFYDKQNSHHFFFF